jgi:hypothetical protein
MGILDELLEKKDINAYVDARVSHLQHQMYKNIKKAKEADREKIRIKTYGRIDELRYLKTVVNNGRIKDESKVLWKRNAREDAKE